MYAETKLPHQDELAVGRDGDDIAPITGCENDEVALDVASRMPEAHGAQIEDPGGCKCGLADFFPTGRRAGLW